MKKISFKIGQKDEIISAIKKGVIVIPTDTIYGLVGLALDKKIVEEIYDLRKRQKNKPMIILISSIDDLSFFSVKLSTKTNKFLLEIWPNPVSVILPVSDDKFEYLHRGTKSLAFRIPDNLLLREIIQATGPLVAPSANFEGEKPSENIKDAQRYFGEKIKLYVDGGEQKGKASTLIQINNDHIQVLRQGDFAI